MEHQFEYASRAIEQVDVMYGVTARALKVKRQRFNWRVFLVTSVLAFFAVFLVNYLSDVAGWTYEFTNGLLVGGWSIVACASVGWLIYCRLLKRKFQRAIKDGTHVVVRFDDSGLTSESGGMSVQCPWVSVRQVMDIKDRLELDLGMYSVYVPLRSFRDRDHLKRVVDEVRNVVDLAKS